MKKRKMKKEEEIRKVKNCEKKFMKKNLAEKVNGKI